MIMHSVNKALAKFAKTSTESLSHMTNLLYAGQCVEANIEGGIRKPRHSYGNIRERKRKENL